MTSPIETNNVVERERVARVLAVYLGYSANVDLNVRVSPKATFLSLADAAIAASERQSLSDRIDVLEGAGNALVAKLNECEPHIANAFAMEHFRGRPYSGPQYKDELDALRASLTQGGNT